MAAGEVTRPSAADAAEERRARQAVSLQQQRDRLLSAMVEIVAGSGYARTSIGELARRAGVSRGTFYELFQEKAECFRAAFEQQEEGLKEMLLATPPGHGDGALEAVVTQLVNFAAEHPQSFEFLFHEALLAGRSASARRDELARWILELVREREAGSEARQAALTVPAGLILGGTFRLITMQIRRGSLEPRLLSAELERWIGCYRKPGLARQWREIAPVEELVRRDPPAAGEAYVLRRSIPKGRHGLAPEALRALQRERMAYGTAVAIHDKGYAEATVSDIVASSGVSRDVFYAEFQDKYEAYSEAAKLVFEKLLAALASAYYGAAAEWPERVWNAGEAFARFLEDHPVLANFLFVGTSFPQPQLDRVNEYVLAFKVFVEDGFAQSSHDVPPIASEALVCVTLARATYQIRAGEVSELRALIPAIVSVVIAPFIGTEAAEDFVAQRTRAALDAA